MKRALYLSLISAVLITGTVAAWDQHAVDASGHHLPAETLSLADDAAPDAHPDAHQCDHCCHAGAHFTGLPFDHAVLFGHSSALCAALTGQRLTSHHDAPPLRPPRA